MVVVALVAVGATHPPAILAVARRRSILKVVGFEVKNRGGCGAFTASTELLLRHGQETHGGHNDDPQALRRGVGGVGGVGGEESKEVVTGPTHKGKIGVFPRGRTNTPLLTVC